MEEQSEEKMKSYIPHRLLIFNKNVKGYLEDPTIMTCMKLAFQWANEMGLKRKKVFGFHLKISDPNDYDPMRQQLSLWCQIECTQEERASWDEIQELNTKNAVNQMLKDDDANNR